MVMMRSRHIGRRRCSIIYRALVHKFTKICLLLQAGIIDQLPQKPLMLRSQCPEESIQSKSSLLAVTTMVWQSPHSQQTMMQVVVLSNLGWHKLWAITGVVTTSTQPEHYVLLSLTRKSKGYMAHFITSIIQLMVMCRTSLRCSTRSKTALHIHCAILDKPPIHFCHSILTCHHYKIVRSIPPKTSFHKRNKIILSTSEV